MILRFAFLGYEIFCLSVTGSEPENCIATICGGSTHDFERLPEVYEEEYDDCRLGFH